MNNEQSSGDGDEGGNEYGDEGGDEGVSDEGGDEGWIIDSERLGDSGNTHMNWMVPYLYKKALTVLRY